MAAGNTLDSIEASLDRAGAVLLSPTIEQVRACKLELEAIVDRLEELRVFAARSGASDLRTIQQRLRTLQKRARLVQSMLRQGSAFYRAAERSEAGSVLGYTPRGLERAL